METQKLFLYDDMEKLQYIFEMKIKKDTPNIKKEIQFLIKEMIKKEYLLIDAQKETNFFENLKEEETQKNKKFISSLSKEQQESIE